MIRALSDLASPDAGLAMLYAGVAASVVWGLVVGVIAAILSSVVRGGGA